MKDQIPGSDWVRCCTCTPAPLFRMPTIADLCTQVDSMTEPVSALGSEAAMRALMVASSSAYNVLEGVAVGRLRLILRLTFPVCGVQGLGWRTLACPRVRIG